MNILIIAENDWSGAAYALREALLIHTAHQVKCVTFNNEWYTQYPVDVLDPDDDQLLALVEWADVVNLHDDLALPSDYPDRPVIKTYHGSQYRGAWQRYNTVDMQKGYLQTALTFDLALLGPHWLGRPIAPLSRETHRGFIVAHAPTNREGKGTAMVIEALSGLDGITLDIIEGVSNAECLRRKARADVLIDQVGPNALGYGTNALEAWAMGIPVISDAMPHVYAAMEQAWDEVPFYRAGTVEAIRKAVIALQESESVWQYWSMLGEKHLRKYHSPKVVATRFAEHVDSVCADGLKVSVCMIVWNEEDLLPVALASTVGLADEIVVVDTGSTDNTVQVARELGCKVITGADRMNKGAARNLSIEHATGDWCVVLDADERITHPDVMRRFMRLTPDDAINVEIVYLDANDERTYSFSQMRAFRRGMIEYRYHAHEAPFPTRGNRKVAFTNLYFEHRRPSSRDVWKMQYTYDRILLDRQEYPDDPRPLFYLARQEMYMERYAEALVLFEQYIGLTGADDIAEAYMHMAQCYSFVDPDNDALMMSMMYRAAEKDPTQRGYWCMLAVCYQERRQHELAVGLFKLALELPRPGGNGNKHAAWYGKDLFRLLVNSLYALGRNDEAQYYLKIGGLNG